MDNIKTYLDNAFAAFPQTQQIQALKRDMLANMEEKYSSLRQHGQNEHEALGTVIANFGSIDEIAAELGLKPEGYAAMPGSQTPHPTAGITAPDTLSQDWLDTTYEQARDHLAQHKKRSYRIGSGIGLVFAGGAIYNVFGGNISLLLLIAAWAAAIPIVIINFKKMYYQGEFYRKNARLSPESYNELAQDHAQFLPFYFYKGVGALALIVLFLWAGGGQDAGNFMLWVGMALCLYVPAMLLKASYDFFLGFGAFRYKAGKYIVHNKKKLAADIIISALVHGLAGYIFAWLLNIVGVSISTAWVVWPMAFIIFGITTDVFNWVTAD